MWNWLPLKHLPVVVPQFACVLYTFVWVLHQVFYSECGVHQLICVSFQYWVAGLVRRQKCHSRLHSTHSRGFRTSVTGPKDTSDLDLFWAVVVDYPSAIPWNIRSPMIKAGKLVIKSGKPKKTNSHKANTSTFSSTPCTLLCSSQTRDCYPQTHCYLCPFRPPLPL